jgi:hypothetical protein
MPPVSFHVKNVAKDVAKVIDSTHNFLCCSAFLEILFLVHLTITSLPAICIQHSWHHLMKLACVTVRIQGPDQATTTTTRQNKRRVSLVSFLFIRCVCWLVKLG